jgi:hypothetical protein
MAILSAVAWLRARGMAVNQELWDGTYEIALTAKRASVRLRARQLILDRIDPIPRTALDSDTARPAAITVNLGVQVNGHAGHPELRAGSLTVHLGGGNGNGAGDRSLRDAGGREDVGGARRDDHPRDGAPEGRLPPPDAVGGCD